MQRDAPWILNAFHSVSGPLCFGPDRKEIFQLMISGLRERPLMFIKINSMLLPFKCWHFPAILRCREILCFWIVLLFFLVSTKAEASFISSFNFFCLKRNRCARGAYVCGGRSWRMELFKHSGKVGPPGEAVELRGQYVHPTQHCRRHSSQWKVRTFTSYFLTVGAESLFIYFEIIVSDWKYL